MALVWQIVLAAVVLLLAIGAIRVAFFRSNDGIGDLIMGWLMIDLFINLMTIFFEIIGEIISNS